MTLLVALALLLLPGTGAALAVIPPGRVSVVTQAALALPAGALVAGGAAFVLAVAGMLDPVGFGAVLAAATVAAWWVAARRGRLRLHFAAARAEARDHRWQIVAGGAVVTGVAVARLAFPPELHFHSPTPWRYWADGAQLAASGEIPGLALQFGLPGEPVVNKVFLSAVAAGLALLAGYEALAGLAALATLVAVGSALAAWALARELGLGWMAPLLPALLFANDLALNTEMTADLTVFRAESFGRMMAFAAAAVAVRVLLDRRGDATPLVVASGIVLGAAATVHVVPAFVAALLVAGVGLGVGVVARRPWTSIRRAAGVAAVAAMATGTILLAAGGDVGVAGILPSSGPSGEDPTLFLNTGRLPGEEGEPTPPVEPRPGPRPWTRTPPEMARAFVASAVGLGEDRGGAAVWALASLVFGGGTALLVWAARRGRGDGGAEPTGAEARPVPDLASVGIASWFLAVALVTVSWAFSSTQSLYVPATFGQRRLFDYSSLPLLLVTLGGVERLSAGAGSARLALAARGVAVAGLTAVLVTTALPPAPPASLRAGFEWIRANVPCDARLLPDQLTEGAFEALTGRVSVLEGAIPYLRPDVLDPMFERLLAARAFFDDPVGRAAFLEEQGVDYVVLIGEGGIGYDLGIGPDDPADLLDLPGARTAYDGDALRVFEVPRAGSTPVPDDVGFAPCRSGPGPSTERSATAPSAVS